MPQLTPVQVLTVQLDPRIKHPIELECERVGAPLKTHSLSTSTSAAAPRNSHWSSDPTQPPPSGGEYAYFEITVNQLPADSKIAIGVVRRDPQSRGYQLNCLPGLLRDSCLSLIHI